jgi:hypothetical protein
LKDELKNLNREIPASVHELENFHKSLDLELRSHKTDLTKITDGKGFLKKHLKNLKPLVGFNTVTGQLVALELLENITSAPTLGELGAEMALKIRLYRPGQYHSKGVEKFAEKLFISKYKSRSPNVTFLLEKIDGGNAKIALKNTNASFDLPLGSTVLSLRTYSGVQHLNITDEEERGIVKVDELPQHVLAISGLLPKAEVRKAASDIKSAYDNFAGKILIARRIRLTSKNAFWVAFYSNNKILGSQLPNLEIDDEVYGKIMALYLNSTIVLLQLIAFAAETEGAWVSLDHVRVWSNIHVPRLSEVKDDIKQRALKIFEKIGKLQVKPINERISGRDEIQRSIDNIALELLGMEKWKTRLDEIYNVVTKELQMMKKILVTSQGKSTKSRKKAKKRLRICTN